MIAGTIKTTLAFIGLLAASLHAADAHSGGLDRYGCHAGSKPYHCHSLSLPQADPVSNNELSNSAEVLEGVISHVRDGDTFLLNNLPIRLAAVDCPETNTAPGQQAKSFLSRFMNAAVTCELTGATTYDRAVGYCSINGNDLGELLFQNTQCRVWEQYDVWDRY